MTRADIITVIVVAIISAIVFEILSDYDPGVTAGFVLLCCLFTIVCQSAKTQADKITVIVVAIISAIVFGILSEDYDPAATTGFVLFWCLFTITCQMATESSKKAESEQAIRLLASIYKYRDIMIDFKGAREECESIFRETFRFSLLELGGGRQAYGGQHVSLFRVITPLRLLMSFGESFGDKLDYKAKQMYFEEHRNLKDEYYDKVISARQEFDHYLSAYQPLASQTPRKSKMQLISEEMSKIEYAIKDRIRNELIIINPDETPDKKQKAEQFLKDMELGEGFSVKFKKLVEKAEKCLRPRILS